MSGGCGPDRHVSTTGDLPDVDIEPWRIYSEADACKWLEENGNEDAALARELGDHVASAFIRARKPITADVFLNEK